MAGELAINTNQNPAWIPPPAGTVASLIYGIVVADSTLLTVALAAVVPRYTLAIVLSTKQIFITENNVDWQAYS